MKNVVRIFIIAMMLLGSSMSLYAHPDGHRSREEREEWFRELRQFKHEYFAKELGLSEAQQTKFFALYDAMDQERRGLRHAVRKAEKQLKEKGSAASDADYEKVAKSVYAMKGQINDIEMKYYELFKGVLTTKQLYKLKETEENFSKIVKKYYRENSGKKK